MGLFNIIRRGAFAAEAVDPRDRMANTHVADYYFQAFGDFLKSPQDAAERRGIFGPALYQLEPNGLCPGLFNNGKRGVEWGIC